MKIKIRKFSLTDTKAIIRLWKACGLVVPDNNPLKDIQRKRKEHPELFLVAVENGKLVGTVMGGYDGHRGAINYLAVAANFQHRGIGQLLMSEVEARLRKLGCPKINLFVRITNGKVKKFYQKLSYTKNKVATSYGKRLIKDSRSS